MLPLQSVAPSAIAALFPGFKIIDVMVLAMVFILVAVHSPFWSVSLSHSHLASFVAVYKACQKKKESALVAFSQVLPIVVYTLASLAWLSGPSSWIFTHQRLHLFILTIGVVFGRMAVRIHTLSFKSRLKSFWPT
jgi:hypothetical protein